MAACKSLQPVVVLTDVMESDRESEDVLSSPNDQQRTQFSEQTEPLDLCLNGLVTLEFSPNLKQKETLSEQSDDDVIFVKEYKDKVTQRCQKIGKGEPRRNPIRKARDMKRFKEYADVDFLDHFSEATEDESFLNVPEKIFTRNEDSEDWKIEDIPKRNKPRRKVINRKLSHKLGRKRKINKIKEEKKKVPLEEIESIVKNNLLLIKDYISDIKTAKKLVGEEEKENVLPFQDATKNAITVFRQQVILLSIVKEIDAYKSKTILEMIVS